MLVELVTHCYAAKYPHYAQALSYQLSSLILHKPKNCKVEVTICTTRNDRETGRVIDWFIAEGIRIAIIYLDVPRLGRRAIGRSLAAKASNADFVWFADSDQVYRNGVLDKLVEMDWPENATMIFPKYIQIHNNHKTGDEATKLIGNQPRLLDIDPSEFIEKRYYRAIGGVQIVKGDFARRHGYLDKHSKWQKPRTDGKPFKDFKDDLAYRGFCGRHGEIVGVDLPGMFRIRHSTTTH